MEIDDDLLQGVRDMAGTTAAGVGKPQLTAIVEAAQAYVSTFKPPEDKEALLVKIWCVHLLTAQTAQISSIKINNVQLNHASGDTDDWYKQFWALIHGLGLGRVGVTGF